MNFTLSRLAAVLGAPAPGEAMLSGVAVDSRRVKTGDLFVALPGARVDGHDFAAAAAAAGARAVLAQRRPPGLPEAFPVVLVPDAAAALLSFAATLKREAGFHLAAVAGSAGKTTTKEFAAAILSRRYSSVEKTPGNQNSAIGFPMSIVNLPRWPEWMVGEMGMSSPGEVSRLSRAFSPRIAVITLIAVEHLEFLGSLDAVAKANAEVLEGLEPDGTFVANVDDPRIVAMTTARKAPVLRFGRSAPADVTVEDVRSSPEGSRFVLRGPSGSIEIALPVPGAHQVSNFLAASALAIAAGAGVEHCAAAAPGLVPAAHRGEFRRHRSGALLYDDAYNASPPSMRAALETLNLVGGSRRIAVLGDMLELGPQDLWFHRDAGRYVVGRADRLVCVGPRARAIGEGAAEEGFAADHIDYLDRAEDVPALLAPMLAEGDAVLFKASRGVGLERAVESLLREPRPAGRRP